MFFFFCYTLCYLVVIGTFGWSSFFFSLNPSVFICDLYLFLAHFFNCIFLLIWGSLLYLLNTKPLLYTKCGSAILCAVFLNLSREGCELNTGGHSLHSDPSWTHCGPLPSAPEATCSLLQLSRAVSQKKSCLKLLFLGILSQKQAETAMEKQPLFSCGWVLMMWVFSDSSLA